MHDFSTLPNLKSILQTTYAHRSPIHMVFPITFGDDKNTKDPVPAKPRAYKHFAGTNDARVL